MTNPTDELTALHELAKSRPGGVEGCAWWRMGNVLWQCKETGTWNYCSETIHPQHALDLVRAEAERFLLEKGWSINREGKRLSIVLWKGVLDTKFATSLPEALAYAMDQSSPSV